MAIYTTFFLCKPDELLGGFPGWRPPLATPVRREFRNPFTGKLSVVETREPEWSEEAEESDQEHSSIEIQGQYEDYLDSRAPAFVRSRPHWATKGLTEIELGPLCEATNVGCEIASPIYGPPSAGAVVQQLPSGLLTKFATLDLKLVARQWAAAMFTPEHTHSVSGVKLSEGWSAAEASAILENLLVLAHQATAGQQLYLLVEA